MTMTFSSRHPLIYLCAVLLALPLALAWADDADECFSLLGKEYLEAAHPVCRRAAEQGDAEVQTVLGMLYGDGAGVEQNHEEMAKWYRMAAEQGHAIAQFNVGVMYREGHGVEQDYEEAVRWFKISAEQGEVRAQHSLGLMYGRGEGVEQDKEEAVKWYRAAAEQGFVLAQYNLGWNHHKGDGVEKDNEEAVKWYKAAAEQGNVDAQFNLGWVYAEKGDAHESYVWFLLAMQSGDDEDSKKMVDVISQHLTDDQIRAAEKEAERRRQEIENRRTTQ